MNHSRKSPWPALLMGVLVLFIGLRALITGKPGTFRDVPLVDWVGFVLVPLGLSMIILSILSLRTWKKPGPFTDEDVRQAKEKLDLMYRREHGTLPGAHESQTTETPAPESAAPEPALSSTAAKPEPAPAAPKILTLEEQARLAKARRKILQGFLLMLVGGILFYTAGGALLLIPASALFLVGLTRLAVGLVERS